MRIISFCIVLFLLPVSEISAGDDSSNAKYKLVWQDEFNAEKLDEAKNWTIIVDGRGGGNKELQYYKKQNISVGKEPASGESCLIITARKENYRNKQSTSGRLSTTKKMSFKYGKLEARIMLPNTANGLWPAFWMLGEGYPSVKWPKCGEIDILEMGHTNGIKNNTQNRYFNGACHWGENYNHGKYPNYSKSSTSEYCLQSGFHLYTLIWDENSVRMYLDLDKYPSNPPYFEMPINGKAEPGHPAFYFHKPFHVIFNLAVGGNFPGIHDIEQVTALQGGEARMYVDYVRLYQKENSPSTFSGKKL